MSLPQSRIENQETLKLPWVLLRKRKINLQIIYELVDRFETQLKKAGVNWLAQYAVDHWHELIKREKVTTLFPLKFAPFKFLTFNFHTPQISNPFNFRPPLFYCKFIHSLHFSSPFNFHAFVLRELAPNNFPTV